jgi:hypothetical protein
MDTQWAEHMEIYNKQRREYATEPVLTSNQQLFACDQSRSKFKPFTCVNQFRQYALDPTSPADPYLCYTLYNEQDYPVEILAAHILRQVTEVQPPSKKGKLGRSPPTRKRKLPTTTQSNAMVRWQASFILSHHLETIKEQGYQPGYTKELASITYQDPNQDAFPIPPFIRKLIHPGQPVLLVKWNPREEPTAHMEAVFGEHWQKLSTNYTSKQNAIRHEVLNKDQQRRMGDLTQLQQQGIWDDDTTYQPNIYPRLQGLVTIDTRPINPDLDIIPTGYTCMQQAAPR